MPEVMDKRVVEMQFDNAQFEKGVEQTMKSLDQLDKSLDTDYSKTSFDGLAKSLLGCSDGMSILAINAENAVSTFAKFEVLGVSIERLTNNLINGAERLVKSLTIDPITSGFNEYETYIDAFQTITAGTRKEFNLDQAFDLSNENDVKLKAEREAEQLQSITDTLDELNTYADKTIYNFTQMTASIGKFTSAGVKLNDSVNAIEGISNLAALAGADSNANNRAMYNISQALSSGVMLTRDWMSIENAGMATEEFKNLLVKVARKRGKTVDLSEGFRESLSDKWLTNEVLLESLQIMGNGFTAQDLANKGWAKKDIDYFLQLGETAEEAATKVKTIGQLVDTLKEAAQSGWTTSWKFIIGDLEEAKEVLTYISEYVGGIINKSAESRNLKLERWHDLGGRDSIINGLKNILETIDAVVNAAKEGFRKFIPESTFKDLLDFSTKFEDATQKIKDFFLIPEIVKKDLPKGIKEVALGVEQVDETAEKTYKASENLLKISKAFELIGRYAKFVKKSISNVIKVVKKVAQALSPIIDIALDFFVHVSDVLTLLDPLFENAEDGLDSLDKPLKKVYDWLIKVKNKLLELYKKDLGLVTNFVSDVQKLGWKQAISNVLNGIWTSIKTWFNNLPIVKKYSAMINRFGLKTVILTELGHLWDSIREKVSEWGLILANDISALAETIWTNLKTWFNNLGITSWIHEKWLAVSEWFSSIDWSTAINNAWTKFKTDASTLWSTVKNWFRDNVGIYIPEGAWEGIISWAKNLWINVVGVFKTMVDKVESFLGIESPSKTFFDIGLNCMLGLWNGLKELAGDIEDYLTNWFSNLPIVKKYSVLINRFGLKTVILTRIQKLFDSITEKFSEWGLIIQNDISTLAENVWTTVSDWWNKVDPITAISNLWTKTKTYISDNKDTVKDWLVEKWTSVSGWFSELEVGTAISNLWTNFKTEFQNRLASIGEWFSNTNLGRIIIPAVQEFWSLFTGIFSNDTSSNVIKKEGEEKKGLFEWFGDVLKEGFGVIWSIADWIIKELDTVFGKIADLIEGEGFQRALNDILDIWVKIKSTNAIGGFASGIKNIGSAVKQATSGIKNRDTIGTTFLKIASSLLILAVAMGLIAKLKIGDIIKGVLVIGVLVAGMAILAKKVDASKGLGNIFLGLAASIAAIALSVLLLAAFKWEQIKNGVIITGIMLAALALFARATKNSGFIGTDKAVLGIAACIAAMAASILILSKLSIGELIQGGIATAVMMAALWGLIKLVDKSELLTKGGSMLGLAGAIAILCASIVLVGKTVDLGELAIGALGLIAAAVALKLIGDAVSTMSAKAILSIAVIFVAMGAAMLVFAKSMQMVNKVDMFSVKALAFAEALGIIIAAFGAMTVLQTLVSNDPKSGGSAALAILAMGISMSIAMKAFANAMKECKDINSKQANGFATALDIAVGAFGLLTAGLSAIGGWSPGGVLAGAVAIIAIGGAIAIVSKSFAEALVISKDMDIEKAKEFATRLEIMSGIFAGIEAVFTAVAALTGGLGALGIAAGAGALLSIGYTIKMISGTFAEALVSVKDVSPEQISAFASALNSMVGAMTGLAAAGGLLFVFEELGLLFINGLMTSLPIWGKDLNKFINNLGNFPEKVSAFDDEALKGVQNLASAITTIFWNDAWTGIADWFGEGDPIEDYIDKIVRLVEGFGTFVSKSKEVGNLDEAIGIVQGYVTSMDKFASTFEGGEVRNLWEKFFGVEATGWEKLMQVSDAMGKFGANFKTFSDGIASAKNIDADYAALTEVVTIMSQNLANGQDLADMKASMTEFSDWMADSGIASMMTSLQEFYRLLDDDEYVYRDKDYSIFRTIAELYSAFAKLSTFDQDNIETATQLIHTITQDLVQDINDDFVLRPVVDMTNVNAAAATINSMFGTKTPIASRAAMTIRSTSMADTNFEFDDSRIVNELQNVRSEVSTLRGAIQEMQVVLDTGAIAGAVSPSVYRYVTNQVKSGMRYGGFKPAKFD